MNNEEQYKLAKTWAKTINERFGSPFLPKGFVKATVLKDGRVNILIGPRDVSIKVATGESTDAGIFMETEWAILSADDLAGLNRHIDEMNSDD